MKIVIVMQEEQSHKYVTKETAVVSVKKATEGQDVTNASADITDIQIVGLVIAVPLVPHQ